VAPQKGHPKHRQVLVVICAHQSSSSFWETYLTFNIRGFDCVFLVFPEQSWQAYIDNMMASGLVENCAIHGLDGNKWASTPGFDVSLILKGGLENKIWEIEK
jgi:hypothetical protein